MRIQETEKSFEWANLRRYTQMGAVGTIFHSIGQMTIFRNTGRGYVQAVEKKPGCNPHCCYAIGQVAPAFADSADTLPDMGPPQEARFPLVRKCRWATIMSPATRQRAVN